MSFLKLHHISFRIVAVAYPMPLKDPLTLRRINTTSEVKHRARVSKARIKSVTNAPFIDMPVRLASSIVRRPN